MFKASVAPPIVAVLCATTAASQAQPLPLDKAKIEAIYRDPMFVSSQKEGQWIEKSNELYPFRRGGLARKVEYRRVFKQEDVGRCSFFCYPGGATALLLSASTGLPQVDPHANWKTLSKGWDAFVARHWPDVAFRRVEEPDEGEFPKTSPRFYNLFVSYSLVQQGIEVADLRLTVQPEDGKIRSVDCHDDRELMRGFVVPPVLSKERLEKAMRSWAETELKKGGALDVSSATIGSRSLKFDFLKQSVYTSTSVSFHVQGKGWGTTIYAQHNDDAGEIESWTSHPDERLLIPTN